MQILLDEHFSIHSFNYNECWIKTVFTSLKRIFLLLLPLPTPIFPKRLVVSVFVYVGWAHKHDWRLQRGGWKNERLRDFRWARTTSFLESRFGKSWVEDFLRSKNCSYPLEWWNMIHVLGIYPKLEHLLHSRELFCAFSALKIHTVHSSKNSVVETRQ